MFGEMGQEKLRGACVFVAGAGGLGTAVTIHLAAAGVGTIRIADRDRVEISNLNRQVFYRSEDLSESKASVLPERLLALNPNIRVQGIASDLTDDNALELAGEASVLVDALDNFPGRYVLNRLALRRGIPLIHGAVAEFYGQVTTIIPGSSACLCCIWVSTPVLPAAPIFGATCGVIGSIQATEVIKCLLGTGERLINRLFVWDGLRVEADIFQLEINPLCHECGGRQIERDGENIR
jgi:adenylyltransferase/sulfurtransferase